MSQGQNSFGARHGFKTAAIAATTLAPSLVNDHHMAQFPGGKCASTVNLTLDNNRRTHTGTHGQTEHVLGALSGTIGLLTHGHGPHIVVYKNRQAGQGSKFFCQRHRLPTGQIRRGNHITPWPINEPGNAHAHAHNGVVSRLGLELFDELRHGCNAYIRLRVGRCRGTHRV